MGAGASTNHVSLTLAGVAALLCLCAAFVAAPAAGAKQGGMKSCGDIPSMYTWDVKVKKVACGKAKDVAKTYDRRVAADLEHKWKLHIDGFYCVLVHISYYADSHRCTAAGGRVITFRRGKK